MEYRRLALALAATGALLVTSVPSAEETEAADATRVQDIPVSFEEVDVNGDGYIEMDEATGHELISYRWSDIDFNQDHRITPAEFAAFEEGYRGQPTNGGVQPEPTFGGGDLLP